MSRDLHSLDFEPREGYLYARATGIRTRQSVSTLTRLVFEKAVDLGFSRVLVNVTDLGGKLSPLDSYLLVTEVFQPIRWRGLTKAAVVDVGGFPVQRAFSEIVARNRGYKYRIFRDQNRAEKWLMAG
jgi:hypothetical protein